MNRGLYGDCTNILNKDVEERGKIMARFKKKWPLFIIMIILISAVLVAIKGDYVPFTKKTEIVPKINIVNGYFDGTLSEIIDIFNVKFKNQGLPLISNEYIITEYNGRKRFRTMASNELMIDFIINE
ncbi:MAG: hypothetical protein ACRCUS_04585, partial [Anaerovoracaceae bacterium]